MIMDTIKHEQKYARFSHCASVNIFQIRVGHVDSTRRSVPCQCRINLLAMYKSVLQGYHIVILYLRSLPTCKLVLYFRASSSCWVVVNVKYTQSILPRSILQTGVSSGFLSVCFVPHIQGRYRLQVHLLLLLGLGFILYVHASYNYIFYSSRTLWSCFLLLAKG